MITRPRFKDNWLIQPNNSQLIVKPNIQQNNTNNNFFERCEEFANLLQYLGSPFSRNSIITKIQCVNQLKSAINQLEQDNFTIVRVYNEKRLSYKGFISWILLANTNVCYLIDTIKLRNNIQLLRNNILENANIIKLVYNVYQTTSFLARDFNIFIKNVFDICYLQTQIKIKQDKQFLGAQLLENPQILVERPIRPKLLKIISKNLQSMLQYTKINKNLDYNKLIGDYYQINFQYLNTCYHYNHYPIITATEEQKDNLNPKKQKLFQSLLLFRQHVGKMYDINVQAILPKLIITKILDNTKISVLQILQLYEQYNYQSIGIELCKRIYDIIQLNQQLYEDIQRLNINIFQKQLSKRQLTSQPNSIKQLLKDMKWGDNNQWLNRKDDPSIKLYKQIISIDLFDYSIGEQYSSMINSQVLKKSQIGRYIKYAHYMRNGNYSKLVQQYNNSLIIKQSQNKMDEFSSQTEQQLKLQQQYKQKTKKNKQQSGILNLSSSTSLDQRIIKKQKSKYSQKYQQKYQNKQKQEQKIKSQIKLRQTHLQRQIHNVQQSSDNSRSRKSSQSNSFINLQNMQKQITRDDIRPLPNTLQEIYQLTQQIKKRADKKIKKKQKKGKQQTKENDSIPTWQDIQQLINQYNNSKGSMANFG